MAPVHSFYVITLQVYIAVIECISCFWMKFFKKYLYDPKKGLILHPH